MFNQPVMTEYTKTQRSTVNRHRERARYDYTTVHSIVNQTSILHISFAPASPAEDPFPTTLPMLGVMASFSQPTLTAADAEPLDLYLHGHAASRIMRLSSSSGTPTGPEGLPVCVAATILDGIKLALTPFNHSCNYRSAVLHGYASLVTDEEEKDFALRLITDGLVPARWENARVPASNAELTATGVLKVAVVSASAKINVGGPADDRKDLRDGEVTGRVWTGVVPVHERLGALREGDNNKVADVPGYLTKWREETNEERERYAEEAAVMKKEK